MQTFKLQRGPRLGSPAHSAGDFSSPCTRVWRRAIHFFLLSIRFCRSQSQAGFSPWHAISWFNTMTTGKRRQAANHVQSVEIGQLITPFVLRKMTAASPDQRSIYDWVWSCNSHTSGGHKPRPLRWCLKWTSLEWTAVNSHNWPNMVQGKPIITLISKWMDSSFRIMRLLNSFLTQRKKKIKM